MPVLSGLLVFVALIGAQPFCAPSCTNCVNNTVCLSCEAGYFQRHCLHICPETCGGDGACDRENGFCQSCVAGTYGSKCERRCPFACAAAADNGTLPRLGGGPCLANASTAQVACEFGCRTGFFGLSCGSSCASQCALSPSRRTPGGPCDGTNCTHGCAQGHYGSTCSTPCDKCAIPSDEAVDACLQATGECVSGCKKGYFGTRCESRCSRGCVNGQCDVTGACASCAPGFCGPSCSPTTYCKAGSCSLGPNASCSECVEGWSGRFCEDKCSHTCARCDKVTGACLACAPGRYGADCNLFMLNCAVVSEQNGKAVCVQCASASQWGESCTQSCSRCDAAPAGSDNPHVVCDVNTGECLFGCAACLSDALALWIPLSIFVFLPLTVLLIYSSLACYASARERLVKRREDAEKELAAIERKKDASEGKV